MMALASCGYGQSDPAPTSTAPYENKVSELPTHQLTFTAGDPVSGLNVSPVIVLPMQCASDGALFFDMLQPPSFTQQALYAVTPKSSRSFEISAMTDLHGVELISFFPGKDYVSVLVRATRVTTPSPGESKVRQSSYGFFVAVFDRQGNYVKSVELAMHNVLPSHVAALTSGEYLVTGYDRANDMPRLYLIGGDGQVIRTLVLPDNLGQYVADDPNSAKGMMNYSRVLGSILMSAHGDEVLVWRRGGRGPILSVGANGSTREVELDVPKGFTLADVLPSDKLWMAHFQEAGDKTSQEQDLRKAAYYQFDPSDGSLTSKISIRGDSPEHVPAILACEEDGTFLSYQTDDKGQTRILSAR
jgi:hypothetical protein